MPWVDSTAINSMQHWALVAAALLVGHAVAQLSAPVSHDDHVSAEGNKFLQNHATLDSPGTLKEEPLPFDVCPQNVELRWSTEVSSSIYATPLITDLYSDGRKDIVVPSFVHYLEVLEADNGAGAVGWPAFHRSTTHASPLLYDIDMDGVQDVLLATYNGEIMFFKDTGEQLPLGLTVPRLKVKKHWFKGLNPDPNIRDPKAMGGDEQEGDKKTPFGTLHSSSSSTGTGSASTGGGVSAPRPMTEQVAKQLQEYRKKMVEYRDKYSDVALRQLLAETRAVNPTFYGLLMNQLKKEGLVDENGKVHLPKSSPPPPPSSIATQRRRLLVVTRGDRDTGDDGERQYYGVRANTFPRRTDDPPRYKEPIEGPEEDWSGDASSDPVADGGGGGDDGGGRRRLLQVTGDGVEEGPEGHLTQEAADSFDVFREDNLGGDGADAGEGEQATEEDLDAGGAQDEDLDTDEPQTDLALGVGEAELKAHQNQEAMKQAAAGGGSGAGEVQDPDGLEDNLYNPLLDEAQLKELGVKSEYDELGDKYDLEEDALLEGETEEDHGKRKAELQEMLASIDTSSMDEDGVTADKDHYNHLYAGDYEALATARDKALGHFWQDEEFQQAAHQNVEEYVYVDAHILATPNIADIDSDGNDELVVGVSYFYDKEYYDQPAHRHELGDDLDTSKYVASGVVVFDLRTRTVKWSQHLDLSTDTTTFKAYAYASPTLADVNKDSHLEVVMGTSMGFLYVLEATTGQPLPGWPIQMGEVQGQALVMDINNDGAVEIVAADTRGNVAAFKATGDELWSRHVKSLVAQGAVAGDINSDGELEIVFGTSSGHIYVLSGTTGSDIKGFPFRTHGRVHAPALITRLQEGPAQHIIVTSFDGYLYLVNGITACADTVDIGETAYSMVLADDLDGNGKLDLLVSTMNGNVYCFETPSAYHPLKAWPSQVMGPNGMLARHDLVGIFATPASRRPRDVAGERLQIQVQVVDKRAVIATNGSLITHKGGPYNITAVLRGIGVKEMASGPHPVIGVADTLAEPGTYTLELPCPRTRSTATIHLSMTDSTGLTLTDEFALSFHMHFHKLLKWLIAGPLMLMVVGLWAALRTLDEEDLEDERLTLPLISGGSHQA